MPVVTDIQNMSAVLAEREIPTVTLWNRLEGRPRADNFSRALKAEVRDALWMLSRQWQLGEFHGDDAGSPIFAKVHLTRTLLTKYRAGGAAVEAFDDSVPLEAKVERRPLPFTLGGGDVALDLRLLMGRHWLRLASSLGNFSAEFIAKYPVHRPDPAQAADAAICAHPEAWSAFAAAAGRRMDGAKLYQYLASDPAHHADDGIAGLDHDAVVKCEERFKAFFARLFYQPAAAEQAAWEPDRLEYRFACAAPEAAGEKVMTAEEYYQGHLDWYNFDIDPKAAPLGVPAQPPAPALPPDTQTLLPAPVEFQGMPSTRWWTFEDRRTNFGDVKPDTTDLGKLLLVEFALVYANDWFLIPYKMPFGAIARITGLAVTNVFGERTWIEAAGRGLDDDWQRWAMFNLTTKGEEGEAADTSLLVMPAAIKVQEGKPLEEILLVRDEVANMVWGIEKTVPLPSGGGKPGAEAARETRGYFERALGAPAQPPVGPKAKIRYQVMTSVPEHWIPFIPVHLPNDNREIQLQRAAMPRIIEGDPNKPKKVHPRTALLREGLDRVPASPYFVHEEEVPRAGVRITQSFQRTRWRDGRTWVWLGARKQTGRGQGSSGLAFDRIADVPDKD